MINIITLGVGFAFTAIVTLKLLSRCVQWCSGKTELRAQNSSHAHSTQKNLFQREVYYPPKTVLRSTVPHEKSNFPTKFSDQTNAAIAASLTESYPYLLDPTGDGNCGIWAILTILILSAQENEATRANISRIINEQREYFSQHKNEPLPSYANAAFSDRARIVQGLTSLVTLFKGPLSPKAYQDFKNELNQSGELSEAVALAFRFLAFQMHTNQSKKGANYTPLAEDIKDFLIDNWEGKPKKWLYHYVMLSTLEFFEICDVPLYSLAMPKVENEEDRNRDDPYSIWEESHIKSTRSNKFCLILNNNHYQLLLKDNPDVAKTTASVDSNSSSSKSSKPIQVQQPKSTNSSSSNQGDQAPIFVNPSPKFIPVQPPIQTQPSHPTSSSSAIHEQLRSMFTKQFEKPLSVDQKRSAIYSLRAMYSNANTPLETKQAIAMTIVTHQKNKHLHIASAEDFFKLPSDKQMGAFENLLQ